MSSYWNNPQNKDPERAVCLQRYLLLHSRSEHLRRSEPLRRDSDASSSTTASSTSSPSTSPSGRAGTSPGPDTATRYEPSSDLIRARSCSRTISSGTIPLMPCVPEEDSDDDQLHEVNQDIKATLTTLLNCESVKHDVNFRRWVQGKLMDVEADLKKVKRERRRRSSVESEPVAAVGDGLEEAVVS